AAAAPEFAQKMGALARERIGGLQKISEEPPKPRVKVLGHRWESACSDLRRFLARNQITFEWMTPDAPDLDVNWPGARRQIANALYYGSPMDPNSGNRKHATLRDCLVFRP